MDVISLTRYTQDVEDGVLRYVVHPFDEAQARETADELVDRLAEELRERNSGTVLTRYDEELDRWIISVFTSEPADDVDSALAWLGCNVQLQASSPPKPASRSRSLRELRIDLWIEFQFWCDGLRRSWRRSRRS